MALGLWRGVAPRALFALSLLGLTVLGLQAVPSAASPAARSTTGPSKVLVPGKLGELDCNGQSPIQQTLRRSMPCTDIRGFAGTTNANTWGGRFYDNNLYIGHDEPDLRFLSNRSGSGENVTWTERLPVDPAALPTVKTPGSDVTHTFELTIAPWFSMAICDPSSYPLTPCKPGSDTNAPSATSPGGGSAFMELQFYPPGFAPFADNISCDNTHWCAALTIDSLECNNNFASCNPNCIEPVNFAFLQLNGVPTGPPSPQLSDLSSFTPNGQTLLMNPGDVLRVHIADAVVPGTSPPQHALETSVTDLTTGQTGFMQASAANGFADTNFTTCDGTPFDFQPEYSTAVPGNIVPWAALQTDISTEFEIGHFTPCSSVSKPQTLTEGTFSDTFYNHCAGPYESSAPGGDGSHQVEYSDALCFPVGDTHGLTAPPNLVSGCLDDYYQNGDLDFDGSSYWPDWPNSTTPDSFPSTFLQAPPLSAGKPYAAFQIQTDIALSESTCTFDTATGTWSGCAVPPPTAPAQFYPKWTLTKNCLWEFGNMANGNDFGADSQYGSIPANLGYPEFLGPIQSNTCPTAVVPTS